jgi:hypothetical protein
MLAICRLAQRVLEPYPRPGPCGSPEDEPKRLSITEEKVQSRMYLAPNKSEKSRREQ